MGDFDLTASANNNRGDGIRFVANDGSGVQINNLGITATNVNVDNNMGNGLLIDLNNVTGLMDFDLSNMTVNDNQGDQINVRFTNMVLGTVNFDNVTADGPGAMAAVGDGLELTLDGTTVTTALNLNSVTGVNNGEDGLQLNLLNMASIPMGSAIDIGTFDSNGQHGINIMVDNSTAELGVTNSGAGLGMVASASNNGANGLNVEVENLGSLTMPSVDNIDFLGNGGAGVMIHTNDSGFFSGGSFTNNDISNNGSFGLKAIFEGTNAIGSDFNLSIGSTMNPGNGNTFDNNVGAAISVDLLQNGDGFLRIVDNTITDTQNDGNVMTPFAGEGIYVQMIGNVIDPMQAINRLQDLLIRNNTIGGVGDANAGHGIALNFQERSIADNVDILNNVITDNGLDGINIFRRDEVVMNSVDINDNMVNRNGDDGLDFIAQNDDNDLINVSVNRNSFVMNGDDGVFAQTGADAQMDLNMTRNTITDNLGDGIHLQQDSLTPTDQRQISGTWTGNTIQRNDDHGIRQQAVTSGLTVGLDGTDGMGNSLGNLIASNGLDGIFIQGPGSGTFTNNSIVLNGTRSAMDPDNGHGIDIEQLTFKGYTFNRNLIRQNNGDGVEIRHNSAGTFTLNFNQNTVDRNTGRGYDILNQGNSAVSSISINNETIASNGLEGVYVVNTASATQMQNVPASDTLMQDGALGADPFLDLFITGNTTIEQNGMTGVGLVESGGLVVRVGSTDGGYNNANGGNNGGFADTRSGIQLTVTDVDFDGNFGDDVFFHGFRSTGDPATTGGTWDDMTFAPMGANNGDSLARMDVIWSNVTVDSGADVNNSGRNGTPDGQAGAFFDNDEPVFKSRSGQTPPSPPGPFTTGTRRRNAQRVAIRTYTGGLVLEPQTMGVADPPDNGAYLYPGMGPSTFRVRVLGGFNPFALDANPFVGPGSANGTTFTGAVFGELPFGWGTF